MKKCVGCLKEFFKIDKKGLCDGCSKQLTYHKGCKVCKEYISPNLAYCERHNITEAV